MSDLISRSELIKFFKEHIRTAKDFREIIINIIPTIENQPTAYDIDKVVEELELHSFEFGTDTLPAHYVRLNDATKIVKQEAEKFGTDINVVSNGWISCSVRLPEEAFGCLVTVIDYETSTQTDFENILPYFVGYDGETWNDADGKEIPFEVIAWMPLPKPYKESD